MADIDWFPVAAQIPHGQNPILLADRSEVGPVRTDSHARDVTVQVAVECPDQVACRCVAEADRSIEAARSQTSSIWTERQAHDILAVARECAQGLRTWIAGGSGIPDSDDVVLVVTGG
jgi:hypothetical protein